MSNLTRVLLRSSLMQARRHASTGGGCPKPTSTKKYSKRMIKFKKLQEKFQRDDGNPIFLKNGAKDRMLYLSTLGLCVLGLILDIKYYMYYMFKEG